MDEPVDCLPAQVLFTTSTRDDRVHPGHARKMVRALEVEATTEQVGVWGAGCACVYVCVCV